NTRTSYTIADDAIRNLTDELFSNPNSSNPGPGLRLNSQGSAGNLNDERIEIGNILEKWQASLNTTSPKNHVALLDAAEKDLTQISTFVSEISRLMSEQDPDAVFTEEVIASYKSRFLGARSRVDSAIQSISSTRNALLSATQSTQGTGVASSETDARIKQALGSLRAAQAAYEKTLVRSPISGVVNAFYLRANEYVGMSTPAAVIANNGALEITTSVSEEERALVTVGNPVDISTGDTTIRGSVTRIAPALDPLSGKIEVKVSVNEENVSLENGGTVSLSLLSGTTTPSADLKIPLRALKITAEGPVAFTVSENNTLVSQPVTLGAILGDLVIIKSGIEKNTRIVTDARGLKEGDAVTIN
ncbi:HlyD family efflux transporter periplasmic adaptor subunit, partial [Patescibacteria group bacterium]|nr:HlyD family efflux transporter periplasmic adaptor subunit [Patescibacteria group bacterium]